MKLVDKLKSITDFNFFVSDLLPSDFAGKRMMKSGESPFVGKYDLNRTPYLREIHDFFSPYNNKNVLTLMKGHQLGGNTVYENGVCYRLHPCYKNIMDPNSLVFVVAYKE